MTETAPRPLIGLTTYFTDATWGNWAGDAAIVPAAYLDAVIAGGGVPVLLPPHADDPHVLDAIDGLLLLGGNDVDPAWYGATPHPETVPDPRRDAQELELVRAALERGTPTLAVCRGAQVLNVALGGTLLQHLPDVLGHTRYRPAPAVFGHVRIHTEPDTRIATILGPGAEVRCHHHQGIDTVAEGLRITARSADGLVQAVEPPGEAWVLGVQFHPEESPEDPRLFEALVDAARHAAQRRATRQEVP